jgi:hypothetical protein
LVEEDWGGVGDFLVVTARRSAVTIEHARHEARQTESASETEAGTRVVCVNVSENGNASGKASVGEC